MQRRELDPEDEAMIRQIAEKTGLALPRLRRAALGLITISRKEYEEILESGTPLPKGIKKPFGN